LIEVLGSKEIKPKPSHLEILQQIKRSISVGLYLDFARQSAIAFFARSMENSSWPAIRLDLMPVMFSNEKLILFLQPFSISSVENDCGGR
jgi:hypothetical protein